MGNEPYPLQVPNCHQCLKFLTMLKDRVQVAVEVVCLYLFLMFLLYFCLIQFQMKCKLGLCYVCMFDKCHQNKDALFVIIIHITFYSCGIIAVFFYLN